MSRLTVAFGLALLAVESAVAVWLVSTSDQEGDGWLTAAVALTAGVMFVLAGLIALQRRPSNRTGVFLAATGYLWLLGALSAANDPWVFTIGWIVGSSVFVPFVALVLVYPSGSFGSRLERAIPFAVAIAVLVPSLVEVLIDPTPASSGCGECPESTLVVADLPTMAGAVEAIEMVTGLALLGVIVVLLVRRWRRATQALRRALLPVLVTGTATLGSLFLAIVVAQFSEEASNALAPIFLVSLGLVPLAFLFGVLRTRLSRASVSGVMVALQEGAPLQDALAGALRDPSLEISYRLTGSPRWVNAGGQAVPEPSPSPGRAQTTIERAGLPIAVLDYDAHLADERELIDAVAAAAGLSIHNERLQAELRAEATLTRTLTDTAPSLLVNIDTDGRILKINLSAFTASGYSDADEVRGLHFWDVFIDPSERDDVVGRFHALAPGFAAAEYENTFTNEIGEERVIYWRSAPVVGEDGKVVSIIAGGLDITERHRLAEAKEREREFLNAIANHAPSLLCLVNEHGRVEDRATNISFEETLGYGTDETGGHIFWERYVATRDADEMRELITRVANGERIAEHDHRWLTRSGLERQIAWTCRALPQIDERRLFLISGVDITEREHLREEKARERDFLYAIANRAPSLICVIDDTGRVAFRRWDDSRDQAGATNIAFDQLLGYAQRQTGGYVFWERYVDPAESEDVRAHIERVVSGAAPTEHDNLWVTSSGQSLHIAWSCTPLPKVDERILFLITGVDVTERKKREQEAGRRRDFLNAIAEAIPSFLITVDPEAVVVEQGSNRAFCEAFGWTEEEIRGRSFLDLIAREDDSAVRVAIAGAADGVPQDERESQWLDRRGEPRVVAWTARPVLDPEGRRLVLVSGSDVTVRRRQEEEIRASRARLVRAEGEARRELERNLHDGAQQRLVALSVALRLVESKVGADPTGASALLVGARDELAQALEELRELARGIHPAVLTDRGLGPALEALAGRAPIPVELEAPAERLAPAVEAAAYYVVAESLTNVAKYGQASSAQVSLTTQNGTLMVTVADDGIGGADPDRGSGLRGLADRVEALEGRLVVESPPGRGTTISAEIPLHPVRPTPG